MLSTCKNWHYSFAKIKLNFANMMLSFVLRLVSGEAMSVLLISKLVFSSIMIEELCFSL